MAQLQLEMSFPSLKVKVVSVTPVRHLLRDLGIHSGCFLGVLICALLSLWGTLPDFLS